LTTLLHPPQVAIVRAKIPGFATLAAADQRRAAAFALRRDFGVESSTIVLTAMAITPPNSTNGFDDVAIAFGNATEHANASIPTRYLRAVQPNRITWFGAPTGFVIGPDGAAAIETDTQSSQTPPREIMSMLSANLTVTEVVVLGEHRFASETLQWWNAATGVTFSERADDSTSHDVSQLQAVRSSPLAPRRTKLDRALWVACAASVACAAVALVTWSSQRASTVAATSTAPPNVRAGDMFAHIATIAPDLRTSLKTATYGGNAWVISLSNSESLQPSAAALRNNGFAVQTVTEPDARLRVSLP
jgi:hypothetical protein